jgi:hypothetical protein
VLKADGQLFNSSTGFAGTEEGFQYLQSGAENPQYPFIYNCKRL